MPSELCSDERDLEGKGKAKRVKSSLPATLEKRRIVVVGAGFAGLSAARTLQAQAGDRLDVVVLESGRCPGGRARTGELPSGTPVELGATWLHGVQGNPLYDLAVWQGLVKDVRGETDLQRHEIDWQLHFVKPPGAAARGDLLAGRLREVALDAVYRFTEAAEECAELEPESSGAASVGEVLRRRFDEAVSSLGLQGEELAVFAESWCFREKLQRTFDGFYCTDDVSLAFPREFDVLDGPNMPMPGGWQALSELLSDGLDIRFGHRVSCIEYGSGGAHITCENGATFECDAVVVTVSLGVLQAQHLRLFQPPLPGWKQAALSAVRIGVADKVFIEFDIDPAVAAANAALAPQPANRVRSRYNVRTSSSGQLRLPPLPSSAHDPNYPHSEPGSGTLSVGTHLSVPEQPPAVLTSPLPSVNEWRGDTVSDCSEVSSADVRAHRNAPAPLHNGSRPTSPGPGLLQGKRPSAGADLPLAEQQPQGQPEPWNMGRRQDLRTATEDEAALLMAATAVAAAVTPAAPRGGAVSGNNIPIPVEQLQQEQQSAQQLQPQQRSSARMEEEPPAQQQQQQKEQQRGRNNASSSAQVSSGSGGSSAAAGGPGARGPRSKQTVHSYAFMWPVPEPAALGTCTAAQSAALLPGGLDAATLPDAAIAAGVPHWCLGLHSVRFSPGPEWVQPSDFQKHELARQHGLAKWQAPHTASGVFWITGAAALEMERLSDEEVTSGLTALLRAFPQIPLPQGAMLPPRVVRTKWGTDPDFLGSYSYARSGVYDGSAADLLAEPLCAENGLPVVLFAGEATHRQYMGTAHGAFLSGCREAGRLVDALDQLDAALAWEMELAGAEGGYALLHPGGAEEGEEEDVVLATEQVAAAAGGRLPMSLA